MIKLIIALLLILGITSGTSILGSATAKEITKEQQPLTDLTGTEWVFNSSVSNIPNVSSARSYSLNYVVDGISYNSFRTSPSNRRFGYGNENVGFILVFINTGVFVDNDYRFFYIVDGTATTDIDLISWFTLNATQLGTINKGVIV